MNSSPKDNWAYKGKYIQICESEVNGLIWEKAFFRGGVVVFPFNNKGELILIREFRPHETPQLRLKPITGIFENHLNAEENALKEMNEEVGLGAKKTSLFLSIKNTGTVNSFQHFVAAWDLFEHKIPNPDGEDSIREILAIPFNQVLEELFNQNIPWGISTLGFFQLDHQLKMKKILIPGVNTP